LSFNCDFFQIIIAEISNFVKFTKLRENGKRAIDFWQTTDRSFGIGKRHRPVLFCRYDVENLINRTDAFFPKKPGFLPNLWATTKDFAKKPGF
jgi:hypothetical protein